MAAAAVIADNEWFKGKRHANQAFQVYDLWKNQNQSPSFLSFRNESNKEQFIIYQALIDQDISNLINSAQIFKIFFLFSLFV